MKKISSFDIFDTCLVRKCGSPENFFDVFSLRAFNGKVDEWTRQEFVAARVLAQKSIQSPSTTLQDIWNAFSWTHILLKSKAELCLLEQETEREMLVPVLKMREQVDALRNKGNHIIYISDMYLPSSLLCKVLREHGFYKDGDSLYVSCENNAEKWNGELFKYICEKEEIKSFRHWHHYGDNKIGDYKAPKKLGVRCTLVSHEYTPYQKFWKDNDYSLGFKYPSILAGLGHALHHSTDWTTHTDFVLDIIAPFYCSLVYRMMKDAEQRCIKRLYFCARDAYMMYRIALQFRELFPSIECKFLYISKTSLYEGDEEAKKVYFEQEGLITKTDKVAIVDFRSSGKTLHYLNEWIQKLEALPIRGYYFETLYVENYDYFSQNCYSEVRTMYLKESQNLQRLLGCWNIYEQFFPLNTLRRTIGYSIGKDGCASPVFDTEQELNTDEMERVVMGNKEFWSKIHTDLIERYVQEYKLIACYSDKIFENCTMPCISQFFETPKKDYLIPLTDFYAHYWNNGKPILLPYIKKCNLVSIVINSLLRKRTAMWRRGMLIYSIPEWLYPFVDKLIH